MATSERTWPVVPPLVAPGPRLDRDQVARWSRHLLTAELGEEAQRRLRAARVCVVGAGGLGAPALLYLAAAGVGRIGIVDSDQVELSNLQRQVIHATADVGMAKVDSARSRVQALDPGVDVVTHQVRLSAENADLLADYDLVIDGTDNFATRYLINDTCVRLGLPEVWGSVLRFDAQVAVFWGRPPGGVLAVQLRDLFPEPPPPDQVPSCDQAGVLGALCGQVGSLMATEAVKLITGVGTPLLGRVLLIDALRARWTEVPLTGRGPELIGDTRINPGADADRDPRPAAASDGDELRAVSPTELADMLATQEVTMVDVREPAEHRLAAIAEAISVPFDAVLAGQTDDIPRHRPVVVYCQFGVRSRRAGIALLQAGWRDVRHLTGGLDAWISQIDPSLPRY